MTRYQLDKGRLLSAPLGDELVFLDQASGQYLAVNTTGRAICERLAAGPADHDDLIDLLTTEFDVDRTTAHADAAEFLRHLQDCDLLQTAPAES